MRIGWSIATRPTAEHGSGGGEKLFFHLLDLAIVNSYILFSSCDGKKISHRGFRLTLITEILARSGHEPLPFMPVGRPAPAPANIRRLDTCHNKHWSGRNPKQRRLDTCHNKHWSGRNPKQRLCRVYSARGVTRPVVFKYVKYDVALCVDRSCFEHYQTKKTYKTYFHSSSMETVGASTTM